MTRCFAYFLSKNDYSRVNTRKLLYFEVFPKQMHHLVHTRYTQYFEQHQKYQYESDALIRIYTILELNQSLLLEACVSGVESRSPERQTMKEHTVTTWCENTYLTASLASASGVVPWKAISSAISCANPPTTVLLEPHTIALRAFRFFPCCRSRRRFFSSSVSLAEKIAETRISVSAAL